jgi:hypothetical protein
MAEDIVDHFPNVLRHFTNERPLKLTARYAQGDYSDALDKLVYDQAIKCQDECGRRGLRFARLRRRQRMLVA